jgi:hypothetical protein
VTARENAAKEVTTLRQSTGPCGSHPINRNSNHRREKMLFDIEDIGSTILSQLKISKEERLLVEQAIREVVETNVQLEIEKNQCLRLKSPRSETSE